MKRLLFNTIIALILFSSASFSEILYVNGVTGKDTNSVLFGIDKDKPFKTIQFAVNRAKIGDMVRVAGKEKEAIITYKENIKVSADKFNIKIIGENGPTLDGSKIKDGASYCFLIEGKNISIEGFKIRNYKSELKQSFGFIGSAAIIALNSAGNVYANLEISACNYGIIIYDTDYSTIQKCKFMDIEKSTSEEGIKYGGVAIAIWGENISAQKILVGTEIPNEISNSGFSGIAVGTSSDKPLLADYTEIKNNEIRGTKSGPAIWVENLDGMVKIIGNNIQDNNYGMYIKGVNIDTWIAENAFHGSKSTFELKAHPSYKEGLFYDVWKSNDNKFDKATYGILSKKNRIAEIGGERVIWNSEEAAKKVIPSGKDLKIESAPTNIENPK